MLHAAEGVAYILGNDPTKAGEMGTPDVNAAVSLLRDVWAERWGEIGLAESDICYSMLSRLPLDNAVPVLNFMKHVRAAGGTALRDADGFSVVIDTLEGALTMDTPADALDGQAVMPTAAGAAVQAVPPTQVCQRQC